MLSKRAKNYFGVDPVLSDQDRCKQQQFNVRKAFYSTVALRKCFISSQFSRQILTVPSIVLSQIYFCSVATASSRKAGRLPTGDLLALNNHGTCSGGVQEGVRNSATTWFWYVYPRIKRCEMLSSSQAPRVSQSCLYFTQSTR